MSEISYHPEALEELAAAAIYLLDHASHEVATRFDAAIVDGTARILDHPQRYPQWVHTRARRYVVPHFPYLIFYLERPSSVRILAIAHTSRRPGYWTSRIAG